MHIISYRGPGMGGGVSPSLSRLEASANGNSSWWFIGADGEVCARFGGNGEEKIGQLSKEIVDGHYRYCNEFLWPIMHDLSEYATYSQEHRTSYEKFNRILARKISRYTSAINFFVQDYQLALMPLQLKRLCNADTAVFWHIPWPKSVPEQYLEPIIDLTKSMLSAQYVGFHTTEYAENFLNFVEQHIPGFKTFPDQLTITRETAKTYMPYIHPFFEGKIEVYPAKSRGQTQVVVAPLGLDVSYWQNLSADRSQANPLSGLLKTDYVLSVDRADYTKGVIPRLKSIAHFFDFHPELKGKITFAQICGKSRMNIEAFAKYYWQTRSLVNSVNAQHGTDDWQPVVDVPGPLNSAELAALYRDASVMLVNPVRDGLNLTAKEFVACQSSNPGALALSPNAGVFDELGPWSVKVNPKAPVEMSASIYHALMMPEEERAACVRRMNNRLHANPLNLWVDTFTELLAEPESANYINNLPLSAAR